MLQNIFVKKIRKISPAKARERLTSGESVYLLDVRTPGEYNEIHIPHSISLPLDQIKYGISKVTSDKDAELIIYCLSGMRASRACGELQAMGYTNVSSLGGIQSWPYETEKGK